MADTCDRFQRTVQALLSELPDTFGSGRVTFHIPPNGIVKVEVSEFFHQRREESRVLDILPARRVASEPSSTD